MIPPIVIGDLLVEPLEEARPESVVGERKVNQERLHLGDVRESTGDRPGIAEQIDVAERSRNHAQVAVAIDVLVVDGPSILLVGDRR